MATIVNNPGGGSNDSGLGLIVGVIIALVLIALFFVYGLPALRGAQAPAPKAGPSLQIDLNGGTGGGSNTGGASGGGAQ